MDVTDTECLLWPFVDFFADLFEVLFEWAPKLGEGINNSAAEAIAAL